MIMTAGALVPIVGVGLGMLATDGVLDLPKKYAQKQAVKLPQDMSGDFLVGLNPIMKWQRATLIGLLFTAFVYFAIISLGSDRPIYKFEVTLGLLLYLCVPIYGIFAIIIFYTKRKKFIKEQNLKKNRYLDPFDDL